MDISTIILGGLAASIASIGFSIVTLSPKSSFIYVPILAFIGMVSRTLCMEFGFKIALATFFAALIVGIVGIFFGRKGRCPAEVYCVPSLLPMVPGKWAYGSLLGLIDFMSVGQEEGGKYLLSIQSNTIMTMMIMFALGVGVAIPIFLFGKKPVKMDI